MAMRCYTAGHQWMLVEDDRSRCIRCDKYFDRLNLIEFLVERSNWYLKFLTSRKFRDGFRSVRACGVYTPNWFVNLILGKSDRGHWEGDGPIQIWRPDGDSQ